MGWGSPRRDPAVDFRIGVTVQPLVNDLAPVFEEHEISRVVLVVTAAAEPVPVGLLGGQGDQLAKLGIVGLGDVFRSWPMAVFALIAGQVRCLGF